MNLILDHISPGRYLVMRNGSRWDPAPGEGDKLMTWQHGANLRVSGPLSQFGYNYRITNTDTGEFIMAKRDE